MPGLRLRAARRLLLQSLDLPLLRHPPHGGRRRPPRPQRLPGRPGAAVGPLVPAPGALPRGTPSAPRLAPARHLHEGRLRLAAQGRSPARGDRSTDAPDDAPEDGLHVLVLRRGQRNEASWALLLEFEDPVRRQAVEVDVQIDRAPSALDRSDASRSSPTTTRSSRTTRWPRSRPLRRIGGSGIPTRSLTFDAAPSSRASPSTPGSGSTRTIAKAESGWPVTCSGRPSLSSGYRGGRTAGSSTA